MRTLTTIFILSLIISCSDNKASRIDFMEGTWKMEGKEQYEVWEKNKINGLKGYSYRVNNNQKSITETLTIKVIDNAIIYEATVPDQNEGKTIPFILNSYIKDYLSFENLGHDFPQKIQYKRINNDEIEVTVLGDENKGFSYIQSKQKIVK